MKVYFKNSKCCLRGSIDGLIFYQDSHTGNTYARRQFCLKNHPSHQSFRESQRRIFGLNPSIGYKRDLLEYCVLFNSQGVDDGCTLRNWVQVYNKLMWALQKKMPEDVNLQTIDREQVEMNNLPCICVRDAIEAGLLPKVKGYERLDSMM